MRSLVISTFVLAAALVPAAALAQTTPQQPPTQGTPPPTTQPPTPPPSGQPPATPPSGQQPAQAASAPGRTFSSDAGMFFNMIKPDKTGDFEAIVARVKQALANSPNPIRKQQAAGWKVFKSVEPGMPLPDGTRAVLYIFYIDPAVKDADYTITKILQEAFPSEVQDLYTKLVAC
jgi:pyruvate/2-oxoglutarate dehydrogenase complex dihydrolipoamide acyltransferase (E2) component